jgi:hypothetical protein
MSEKTKEIRVNIRIKADSPERVALGEFISGLKSAQCLTNWATDAMLHQFLRLSESKLNEPQVISGLVHSAKNTLKAASNKTLANNLSATPQTHVQETVAPQAIAPQTHVQETVTPQAIAPQTHVQETVTPQAIAPQTHVQETVAPQTHVQEQDDENKIGPSLGKYKHMFSPENL